MPNTTDPAVQIRDGVFNTIVQNQNTFEIGTIHLEKTYFPQENLDDPDLEAHPHIKVVGFFLSDDIERELRLAHAYKMVIPVQVAIQQKVDRNNTTYIDKLHRLIRQVLRLLEDDELVSGEDFTWERTTLLKDENGLIYNYEQLAAQGVFQVVFTGHYSYIQEN